MPVVLFLSLSLSAALLVVNAVQFARREYSSRADRRRVRMQSKTTYMGDSEYIRTVPGKHRMGGREAAHEECVLDLPCAYRHKRLSQVRAIAYIRRDQYEREYELRTNTMSGLLCGYSTPTSPPSNLPGLSKPSGSRHALRPDKRSMPTEPISLKRKPA